MTVKVLVDIYCYPLIVSWVVSKLESIKDLHYGFRRKVIFDQLSRDMYGLSPSDWAIAVTFYLLCAINPFAGLQKR